ncbi:LysR family transcriptional regulator [Sphingosinithalassobacter sp. CS137]|uniref:LysR family transcriptional regulator n=1 Tax=Sphingosinithalassobacter sp. CS137 TaxID=2762748 RepID=UPI00165D4E3F|nr:LysR family transcriptional regulator [Sphingosinithalassobacter sp. CS137]
MTRPALVELDAVLAIARRGSFRAAALELGISTTALSNAVAKLERELGIRLFNRTTRSVSLTDAGRNFVAQIGPALGEIHEAMNAARSQQEVPAGTLRINAFATAAREVLSPLILKFIRLYPQVHIDLVTEGRLIDIVDAGFDFGVRRGDLVPSDMIAIPLQTRRRYAVVGTPAYFARSAAPQVPTDLLQHPCIRVRLPNGALFRWHFEKEGRAAQIDVQGPITLDEASLARAAVLQEVGVGFFMESDIREDLADGRLVEVLQDWTPPIAPLSLYYPGRRNASAAFRAFTTLARNFQVGP